FVDLKAYSSRLKQAQSDTGLKDAVINAHGKLNGRPVIVSAMEYSFIGGSMGAVVGEAITRAIEQATDSKQPIIIISASGGARMMEGVVSLMQLAKLSAALARLDERRLPAPLNHRLQSANPPSAPFTIRPRALTVVFWKLRSQTRILVS